jgi:hypothetical protein
MKEMPQLCPEHIKVESHLFSSSVFYLCGNLLMAELLKWIYLGGCGRLMVDKYHYDRHMVC